MKCPSLVSEGEKKKKMNSFSPNLRSMQALHGLDHSHSHWGGQSTSKDTTDSSGNLISKHHHIQRQCLNWASHRFKFKLVKKLIITGVLTISVSGFINISA